MEGRKERGEGKGGVKERGERGRREGERGGERGGERMETEVVALKELKQTLNRNDWEVQMRLHIHVYMF